LPGSSEWSKNIYYCSTLHTEVKSTFNNIIGTQNVKLSVSLSTETTLQAHTQGGAGHYEDPPIAKKYTKKVHTVQHQIHSGDDKFWPAGAFTVVFTLHMIWSVELILKKIIKMVATKGEIL